MSNGLSATLLALAMAWLPAAAAGQASPDRAVGTVKAVGAGAFTLVSDAGAEVSVQIQPSTRMLQTAPGEKDLANATPIKLEQMVVGDRVLVRGKASDDGKTIAASSVLVMKQADVAHKQQRESEDWQRRGVGGLVSTVDAASGTIKLATTASGGNSVVVHVPAGAVVRRYAPDSVKFDEAVRASLDQVHPGDQLRARGARSPEGGEFTAEEIVSGTFRNIAGVISSIDQARGTLSLTDLSTKKSVVVKITAESQMRKLPPQMAQMIATRLKAPEAVVAAGQRGAGGGRPEETTPGGAGGRSGRPPDLQQILNRVPAATLADLQKGDAVMMVTTTGSANGELTAITLLSGVEPILTSNQAASLLSPWNLGAGESQ